MNKQMMTKDELTELAARFAPATEVSGEGVSVALVIAKDRLLELLRWLKEEADYQFTLLSNETAVDYPEYFELVCHLYSCHRRQMLTVKARCSKEEAAFPSLMPLWPGANFQEREIYDLLGLTFTGHPQLQRILLPAEFTGHPLRKDFKAAGQEV